ncbi:DUF2155 domain-containing protein [Sulfitobacter guttiformis]|uniref:Uncharacterized protein DUF2155 n=1 Tax=Sulfitobacter guttiformis TaxID=74349 RepID=A0A420DIU7_9RHOB|nr:DUF2155 domain-containing protein [Sulfitobacter guttiformis]KIN72054.1 hypothetical protein Z949_1223 [Sulfitobacter guttiformis KCTC 32187]RKE94166.1 uncharacterized protein DUF2155 [Sulfitobacter guttiformis]
MRALALGAMFCAGTAMAEPTNNGSGAILRALDKTSGTTVDLSIPNGQIASIGRLKIVLNECRYPEGNPSGDAYAAIEVSEIGSVGTVFTGWMIASAPALNAMEHSRYDIWVMRCITS